MRTYLMATTLLVSAVFVSSSFAAGGLHKHDNSIANHGYNIMIDTTAVPGEGMDLKEQLDKGLVGDHIIKKPAAPMPSAMPDAGAVKPLQAPQEAEPMVSPQSGGDATAPIDVGTMAPNIMLPSANGNFVSLADKIAQGPTLVLFIRNTSSPYDIQQLQLLQKNLAKLNQFGIQVMAVTPDPLDNIQRAQQKYGITYDVVSDNTNVFAQQFGVLQFAAPTPSLFSIDQTGKIAAIQLQPKMSAVFDLNDATAPFLNAQTSNAAPAQQPQQQATASTMNAPVATIAAQEPAAGTESLAAPTADRTPPATPAQSQTNNVMPAVPSPQADKLFVPKISLKLPPSHPDYKKSVAKAGLEI